MTAWTRALGFSLGMALLFCSFVKSDEKKVTGDLKKMQGTWLLPAGEGKSLEWVFDGDTMRAKFGDTDYVSKVTVNEKAVPQSAIDFEILEGSDEAKGKIAKAIYKFEDNDETLTICVALPDQDDNRPNEFRGLENLTMLFKLKKDKK